MLTCDDECFAPPAVAFLPAPHKAGRLLGLPSFPRGFHFRCKEWR